MELELDLLAKKKKSNFFLIVGALCFLGLGIGIALPIYKTGTLTVSESINAITYLLLVTIFITNGLGYSIERLFGKAHILINSEFISMKLGVTNKEQIMYWKDIKSIKYKFNKYHIELTDKSISTFDLSKIEFVLKKEIRKVIDSIAQTKNIQSV